MRFLPLLYILAATAYAQIDPAKMFAQGVKSAFLSLAPVSEKDQSDALAAATGLLNKHVTFHPDGSQTAICSVSGNQQVEWKGLVIKSITSQPVNDADKLNGISKRCFVSLSCDASRTWNRKTNAWDKWQLFGHGLFPSGITVEQTGGKWTALESAQLKWFSPGPGEGATTTQPDPKSDGLPPGMTRRK